MRVGVLAVVAGAAALLTAGAQARAVEGTTLKVDVVGSVTLDPAYAIGTASWQYQYLTGLKLYNHPDSEGAAGTKVVPEAASGYKVSDDGKTYTFTIRSGLKFSDGKGVAAANFAAALERTRTQPALPGSRFLSDVKSVKPAGNRLTVRLKQPAPDFITRMAMPFFSAIPTGTPATQQTSPRSTAGPYYPTQFGGGTLELGRNPLYGGKRPRNWSAVILNLGIPRDRQVARCENGQADVCSPDDDDFAGLAEQYGINKGRFFVRQTLGTNFLLLNSSRPLFKTNPKLRQAVNFAIDRPSLANATLGFLGGRATDQILPPGFPGYRDAKLYPLTGVNAASLSKARALANGNTRSSKAVFYTFNVAPGPAIADVVRFNLRQIGIETEIKTFQASQYAAAINRPNEPYDMAVSGWGSDYPDPYNFINVLLDGRRIQSGTNRSYFNSQPYNAKMDAAAKLSGTKRLQAYGQLDIDLMKNQAPLAPYMNANARVFVSPTLGCYTYHSIYGTDWAALCRK